MKTAKINDVSQINTGMLNTAMKNAEKFNFEEALKGLTETNDKLTEVIQSQNDIIKAVVTVYQAVSAMAKQQDLELPEPLVDMTIEQ